MVNPGLTSLRNSGLSSAADGHQCGVSGHEAAIMRCGPATVSQRLHPPCWVLWKRDRIVAYLWNRNLDGWWHGDSRTRRQKGGGSPGAGLGSAAVRLHEPDCGAVVGGELHAARQEVARQPALRA